MLSTLIDCFQGFDGICAVVTATQNDPERQLFCIMTNVALSTFRSSQVLADYQLFPVYKEYTFKYFAALSSKILQYLTRHGDKHFDNLLTSHCVTCIYRRSSGLYTVLRAVVDKYRNFHSRDLAKQKPLNRSKRNFV
jgi:hypothetical protein